MLIEAANKNPNLTFPIEFHNAFSESLEDYSVDSQTVMHLWKDLNKLLENCKEMNLRIELLKFLNGLLGRVNLTNQRLPSHLKAQAIQSLDVTKTLLTNYLRDESDLTDKVFIALKNYFICLLKLCIIYDHIWHIQICIQMLDMT